MTLDLDLDTTIVAVVKTIVDTQLESAWRASGVRILRSDLPFRGINLRYQNRLLAMDEVLSSCKVEKDSTVDAEWPHKGEKGEKRKRYGKGRGQELVLEGRRRAEGGQERAKKALCGSDLVEVTTQDVSETSGEGQIPSGSVSGDGLDEYTEVEAGGDGAEGMQGFVNKLRMPNDKNNKGKANKEMGQGEEMGRVILSQTRTMTRRIERQRLRSLSCSRKLIHPQQKKSGQSSMRVTLAWDWICWRQSLIFD